MTSLPRLFRNLIVFASTLLMLLIDAMQFLQTLSSSTYDPCGRKPLSPQAIGNVSRAPGQAPACHRCYPSGIRLVESLVRLAAGLAIVQPATFTRWHRQGFRLFWRRKSRCGRPPIPADLQALIRRMARENPTWGQERIANELLLKLGLRVSPRTVRKYMSKRLDQGPGTRVRSQRWATFVRNHAQAIVACDFCVVITATFRLLYVFVVIEHASRRLLHVNVTAHPTAEWTLQQLREAIPSDHTYRFVIHDRDRIFSAQLDQSIRHLGLRVLQTPPRAPQANAVCERVLGSLRRECLDLHDTADGKPPTLHGG